MILLNDFKRQWEETRADALAALEAVGASGWYILGEEVRGFEAALAAQWGRKHAVGVASGLDALEIGLRALGCGPGEAVLTTPLSAFATTLAIVKLGAAPVFVDTDRYGLLDLERCREALRARPEIRFLVPVHLYGHALNLERLAALKEESGCRVVEDCAQSIGASWRGVPAGAVGDCAAASFYPTKNLGAMGDGGAILADKEDLRDAARALRDYGQCGKYRHDRIGYNSRLDELQAGLMRRVYLPRLAGWTARRRQVAGRYVAGIRHAGITVPGAPEGSESVWHLFPVLVAPEKKAAFMRHLAGHGVGCGEHYPVPIPAQPAMAGVRHQTIGECAVAAGIARSEVSLPIHPYLRDEEVDRVIEVCNGWEG